MSISRPLGERFWEKIDKNGPTHPSKPELGRCWLWTDHTVRGYGQIVEGAPSKKKLSSHRVSWELHNGPIPVGEGPHGICVCHNCDNPPCVNPAHLFLGTIQDNINDKMRKRRQPQREKHGRAKLTEKKVAEIRRDYVRNSRAHGQPALARKYGVNHTAIGFIVREKHWKEGLI